LFREPDRLRLRLTQGSGVFAGDAITRRLERLAQSMGLEASIENH
jgi:exopolyphosphatase/guanosine-5'-triphosphate,3'-diphosphate pyrophosphatase